MQEPNTKQIPSTKVQNSKVFDLDFRTLQFSKEVIKFIKPLPNTITNREFVKQLIRSSSSIGANYIEANESLGKKDFYFHIKICRKEAKETVYWLKLLELNNMPSRNKCDQLIDEATQLKKIFNSIIQKSKS
jgi:four helix bundle protein